MQIVIDIPEELYDRLIIKGKDISEEETSTILDIIADGIILPKNHGRLISVDAIKNIIMSGISVDTDDDKEYVCELIDNSDGVIKANMEAENG